VPAQPLTAHRAPAPSRTAVTRPQLIELGRAGRPWAFLPTAVAALESAPDDAALRFLAAANFARLGLVTPARAQLARLDPGSASAPEVAQLAQAIAKLPGDRVPAERLQATCRANLNALAERGVDLREAFERWKWRLDRWVWLRARDGNVVRCRGAGDRRSDWLALSDQVGEALRFGRESLAPIAETLFPMPLVIEGVDPPWMLQHLVDATTPSKLGYRPRIRVLQADPVELLDGLAQADLTAVIADPRISFFTGPDAAERLRSDLHDSFHAQIPDQYILLPTVRTRVEPAANTIIGAARAAQQTAAERLNVTVQQIYVGRDRTWWARRYHEALTGEGPPLRVLVPTTRFSTYIQHAARDVVEAFGAIGCKAELFIEADDHTKSSSIAYQAHLARFRPDLVVLVNYTRANTGGMFPAPLPVVCWVQDAMWQQLNVEVGTAQTEMDFLAGHLFPELFERFGYPRRNALTAFLVVSPRKFHAGPVDPSLRRRHACEIAYAGHQSETPQAQLDRLRREVAADPTLRRCLDVMYPRIRELATGPMLHGAVRRLSTIADDALREVTGQAEPQAAARLLKLYAQPLADRILRHDTLRWAAAIARRRGWRLRIYGRGWSDHPDLAEFACGELNHGEELRAAYHLAAVHLHLTINTNRHQRVLECLFSGGLPLCRRKAEDIWPVRDYTLQRLVRECAPAVADVDGRRLGYRVADHPDAMALAALGQRYGKPIGPFVYALAQDIRRRRAGDHPHVHRESAWLLGDPAEITFEDPIELERLVERAVERPAWRENLSRSLARRAKRRCTTDHFARRVVDLVRSSFA
jgi:hypothetical protein